jgi:hypothetical protein
MFMCFFWFSEQTWISAAHLFIKIQEFINNEQMHLLVYDVFYSRYSQQRFSAGIPAISGLMVLLQE